MQSSPVKLNLHEIASGGGGTNSASPEMRFKDYDDDEDNPLYQ